MLGKESMGESTSLDQNHDSLWNLFLTQSSPRILLGCPIAWYSPDPPMMSKRSSPAKVRTCPWTSPRFFCRDPWKPHQPYVDLRSENAGSLHHPALNKHLKKGNDFLTHLITCCSDGSKLGGGSSNPTRCLIYPCAIAHVKRVCPVRRKCQPWLRDSTEQMS